MSTVKLSNRFQQLDRRRSTRTEALHDETSFISTDVSKSGKVQNSHHMTSVIVHQPQFLSPDCALPKAVVTSEVEGANEKEENSINNNSESK